MGIIFLIPRARGPRDPRVPGPRGPGDPGTRDPGDPGPGDPGGSGKVPGGSGTIFRFFGSFLLETGYSDAAVRILAKNYIYELQDHRKWMKVDPFRAHLKLRALDPGPGRVPASPGRARESKI